MIPALLNLSASNEVIPFSAGMGDGVLEGSVGVKDDAVSTRRAASVGLVRF